MRPVLKPALRQVWRDETTLQLGLDPARAVVLRGIAAPLTATLELLDGSRQRPELVAAAVARGAQQSEAEALLDVLGAAGALDDAGRDPLLGLDDRARGRLEPDLASLSLLHDQPGAGAAALLRRRAAVVHVDGAGRVGAPLARLLDAAGVGTVTVRDIAPVVPADLSPGGLRPRDVGRDRGAALRERLSTGRQVATGTTPDRPALVVLAPVGGASPPATALTLAGIPHLLVAVRETTAVVGPLVLPGVTCCLDCLDLHRGERDADWPLVAAQLGARTRGGGDACDTALAAVAAGLAALQALALLDAPPGAPPPAAAGGTLELALPDWRVRRRSWAVHPSCPCVPQ